MNLLFLIISYIFTFPFTEGVFSNTKNNVLFVNGLPLGVPPTTASLIYNLEQQYSARETASTVDGLSKTGLVVDCGEKNWRITVKRDFFGRGVPFSPNFIRLGEDPEAHGACAPRTDRLSTEMVLSAGLQDCGSKSEVSTLNCGERWFNVVVMA